MIKLISFLLFSVFCFSQNENTYKINKEIKIDFISFEKTTGPIYRTDKSHILTKVVFHLLNDSCFVFAEFTDDKKTEFNNDEVITRDSLKKKYNLVLSKKEFLAILNKIQNIDFQNIEKDDFNIYDGKHYKINFSNPNCEFNYSFYALDYNKSSVDAAKLMKLFEESWKFVEK